MAWNDGRKMQHAYVLFDPVSQSYKIVDPAGNVISAPGGGGNLPNGGATGQALLKTSNADGDATWYTLTATSVGLGSVDNTSDVNKPVSTAQAAALALKLNTASPSYTGQISSDGGSSIVPKNTLGGTVINVAKMNNILNFAVDVAPTFSTAPGVPTTDTWWGCWFNNTDAANSHVVTLPQSVLTLAGTSTSTFTVKKSGRVYINFWWDGTNLYAFGIPVPQEYSIPLFIESAQVKTYTIRLEAERDGTIDKVVGKLASGTATVKVQINGVDVTTSTLNVTNVKGSVVPTAANKFVAGDKIDLVVTAVGTPVDLAVNIQYNSDVVV